MNGPSERATIPFARRTAVARLAADTAAASLSVSSTQQLARTGNLHASRTSPIVEEPKQWGIAGVAKDATRSTGLGVLETTRVSAGRPRFAPKCSSHRSTHLYSPLLTLIMEFLMKSIAIPVLFSALLAGPALAQQKAEDHSAHHPANAAVAGTNVAEMSDGEVRKVDKDRGKLTLRHGEIKSLEMPPMTMVFEVKEPALLDKVAVGDKVKFRAEQRAGVFVVTVIEPVK